MNFCIIDQDDLILLNEPTGGAYIYKYSPEPEVEAKIIISKLLLEMLSRKQAEVIGSSDFDFKHKALNKINEDRKEVLKNIPVQWQ